MDNRDSGQTTCNPAHDIRTNPAMQMNQIRSALLDDTGKATDETHVKITFHPYRMDICQGPGHGREIASFPTGQNVFDASRLEPFHEEDNLMGAAVEIAATLDVKNLHR